MTDAIVSSYERIDDVIEFEIVVKGIIHEARVKGVFLDSAGDPIRGSDFTIVKKRSHLFYRCRFTRPTSAMPSQKVRITEELSP